MMDYSWAVTGAKVVCINDDQKFTLLPGYEFTPTAKSFGFFIQEKIIYTIRAMTSNKREGSSASIRLKFEELCDRGEMDFGYDIRRFKPVTVKKLPASLLVLLTNPSVRERELI